jgi:hypothetical protein
MKLRRTIIDYIYKGDTADVSIDKGKMTLSLKMK